MSHVPRPAGAAPHRARPQLQGRWLVCQRLRPQKQRAGLRFRFQAQVRIRQKRTGGGCQDSLNRGGKFVRRSGFRAQLHAGVHFLGLIHLISVNSGINPPVHARS